MRKAIIATTLALIVCGLIGYSVAGDYTPRSAQGGQNVTSTSVTNGSVIPSTVAVQILEPAAIATCTVANAQSIGQMLLIINNAATNVTFADSGNLELSSAAVLNVDDSIYLFAVTTSKWVEISQGDN